MKAFRPLISQRGQSVIIAIVLAAAAAITTSIMITESGVTKIASRAPRIRSGMANLETKLRSLMLQPTSYTCADPNDISTCQLTANLQSLNHQVPGARCSTPGGCLPMLGLVIVSNANPNNFANAATDWNLGTRTLNVQIRYTGNDFNIAPRAVSIIVPTDVLSPIIRCDPTPVGNGLVNPGTPLFRGFDTNGQAVCSSVPPPAVPANPNVQVCASGQFLSHVDTNNFTLTCLDLPPPVACANPNEFITGYSWAGGANPVVLGACSPRQNPMTGFSPTVSYGIAPPAYVPPAQPADYTNACTPPAGSCVSPDVSRGPFYGNPSACTVASCNAGESLNGCYFEPGGFRSCCAPPAAPTSTTLASGGGPGSCWCDGTGGFVANGAQCMIVSGPNMFLCGPQSTSAIYNCASGTLNYSSHTCF